MKNVAIIMGGYSSEYKISLTSGNVVYNYLDKTKYQAYRIHIFKDKWVYVDANDVEYPINKNDFSVEVNQEKITFCCILFDHRLAGLVGVQHHPQPHGHQQTRQPLHGPAQQQCANR